MRIIWPLIISGLGCLAAPAAFGDDWPITFAKLAVPSSAYGGAERRAPADCQPELFDPAITRYRQAISSSPAPASSSPVPTDNSAAPATYKIDGGDEGVTLTIDSFSRQDDAKTALPEPYSLTRYMFGCAGGSSQVFEFKKSGKRYALYTHVSQGKFSADRKKLVLYNYAKPHHGPWQELRRIIEIHTRKFTPLPVINETAFLADASNDRVVTYGLPARATAKQTGPRRIAAIWGPNGKLIQALSVPTQPIATGDAMGLLPDEPSTFYHLTRTGDNACTLRLQDIQHADGQRSIQLAVPGAATDPAEVGMRVQIDLAGLKLKGGAMKYRVSASGKGDASNDWGPWQAGQ